ncbi:MAG: Spy/CpxP family protein refolding chaperone [Gemmatimonadota bacterium]|nr:Spy/CpxP family protein refolding chaperone [Gemmatimonadota bacterium]
MLFNGITLTDAQKAQVDSIRARYRAQMPPRTPGTPPNEATREKRRTLMKAQTDEMRALLTDDQKKTFDANLAEMQSRMQQRPPAPPQS